VLDETLAATRAELGSAKMKGRASLLKSLMAKADDLGKDFNVRPVEMDRKALTELAGKRGMGDAVDGIGGFVLEATDGSVSYDMRFDTLLETSWKDQLSSMTTILFE
jgi:vacuolar-type H+-ATPase subunit E/Vma4